MNNLYNLYVDYVGFDGTSKEILRAYKIYMYDLVKILKTLRIDECSKIAIIPDEEDECDDEHSYSVHNGNKFNIRGKQDA